MLWLAAALRTLICLVTEVPGRDGATYLWLAPLRRCVTERGLGRYLGAQLHDGEVIVSDMPRLCFFAGTKPPPPRRLRPDEILAQAAMPGCRFVVLVAGRTDVSPADLRNLGLEPMDPPGLLSAGAGRRGIQLYAKPRPR